MPEDNVRYPVMLPLTKREKALYKAFAETHNPAWSLSKSLRVTSRACLLLRYGRAKSIEEALEMSEKQDRDK